MLLKNTKYNCQKGFIHIMSIDFFFVIFLTDFLLLIEKFNIKFSKKKYGSVQEINERFILDFL